jgi:phage replication O-like protein O
MVGPQLERGYTRIANEIFEQISKTNLNGTQLRIVMVVWRYTYGFQRKEHQLSNSFIAEAIGVNHRSIVIKELRVLIERKIINVVGTGLRGARILSFNKHYHQWIHWSSIGNQSRMTTNQSPALSTNQSPVLTTRNSPKIERSKESIKENIYVEIINYLNQKTGRRFSSKSVANKKLINGRMSEGRTFNDFKYVIDVKCEDWLDDPKWSEYLRPSTLFRPLNFENYLNQKLRTNKESKQVDPRDKEIAFQQWMQENPDKNPNEFNWVIGSVVDD